MKNKYFYLIAMIAVLVIVPASARSHGPAFSEWSALKPVTAVNTPGVELIPRVSHDGLRLYFFRGGDIWLSKRRYRNADWGTPAALPNPINKPDAVDTAAFESKDGHWLFFGSTRSGGLGSADIWVSYRRFVHDDSAWQEPVNLTAVNTPGFEGGPMLYEDEDRGITQLYFGANPTGPQDYNDIYVSTLGPNGFGPPVPVAELNSAAQDGAPWLRRDGLEMFFASYREGLPAPFALGSIYVSTRRTIYRRWSAPQIAISRSAPGLPGDNWISTPSLSRDGMTLYVSANQPGTGIGDIFVAHRRKFNGPR